MRTSDTPNESPIKRKLSRAGGGLGQKAAALKKETQTVDTEDTPTLSVSPSTKEPPTKTVQEAKAPPVKREKKKVVKPTATDELKEHQGKTRYTEGEYIANDEVSKLISERVGVNVTQSEITRALWALLRLSDESVQTIHHTKFEPLEKCARYQHDKRAANEIKLAQFLQAVFKNTPKI